MNSLTTNDSKYSHEIRDLKSKEEYNTLNRWTAQLLKSMKNVTRKNKLKYEAIIKHRSQFSFQLYQPELSCLPQSILEINGQLLLKQLDILLEDQSKLDKEINQINFEKQEHELLRQIEIESQMDHYSFLRSIWKRDLKQANIQDRLERLNQNVGSIKGHIKTLISQENQTKVFEFSQAVFESQQYQILKEKYQRLRMSQEEILSTPPKNNLQQLNFYDLQRGNQKLKEALRKQKQVSSTLQTKIKAMQSRLSQLQQLLKQKQRKLQQINKKKYQKYESNDDLIIWIQSNELDQNSSYETRKTIKEIHNYLTGQAQKLEQTTFKVLERQNKGLKNRMNHIKNQIDDAKKIRHIKGVQEMKSADFKRPKFIRSSVANEQKIEEVRKKLNV